MLETCPTAPGKEQQGGIIIRGLGFRVTLKPEPFHPTNVNVPVIICQVSLVKCSPYLLVASRRYRNVLWGRA